MKKLIVFVLALILLISALTASAEDIISFPFVEDGESCTLTVTVPTNMGPAAEMWCWKWLSEKTGINFVFNEIDDSVRDEKLNLMFSSNDLTDLVLGFGLSNLDIIKYGSETHALASLNELIDAYAPNLKAFFEENPSAKAQCTAPDGNIYALCKWTADLPTQVFTEDRAWINQQWLNNLGLDRPETLDEFYDVLVAFRDNDPNGNGLNDEIPICETPDRIATGLWSAYGVVMHLLSSSVDPAVKNGEAVIPAASEMYRSYIETMRQWYTEGLIDEDCYTLTTTQLSAKATERRIGVQFRAAAHTLQSEGWEEWEFFPIMTSEYNDTKVWPGADAFIGGSIAMSEACENKIEAMKVIDWFYTEQAAVYFHYGPMEGTDDETMGIAGWYFDENGNGPLHHLADNDKFASYPSDLYYRATLVAPVGSYGLGTPFKAMYDLFGIVAAGRTGAAGWWRRSANEYAKPYYTETFPSVFLSAEEAQKVTELYTPLKDYVTIMEAKFITGIEPMENFEAYMEQLNVLGLQEYTEIYTNAFNVYKANLG